MDAFLKTLIAITCLLPWQAQAQPSPYEPIPAATLEPIEVFYNKVGRVTFGSDGSVRRDEAAPLIAPPPVATDGAVQYTRIGGTTFRSDGVAYNRVGDMTVGSEGITYKRLGNSIFGSDGSTYIEMGDTIIGGDGSRYRRDGDRLVRTEAPDNSGR